jgi:hypothetical protein
MSVPPSTGGSQAAANIVGGQADAGVCAPAESPALEPASGPFAGGVPNGPPATGDELAKATSPGTPAGVGDGDAEVGGVGTPVGSGEVGTPVGSGEVEPPGVPLGDGGLEGADVDVGAAVAAGVADGVGGRVGVGFGVGVGVGLGVGLGVEPPVFAALTVTLPPSTVASKRRVSAASKTTGQLPIGTAKVAL